MIHRANDDSALLEAKALIPLLRRGDSVESVRALIGLDRWEILREFDLLVLRLPTSLARRKRLRLRKKCNGAALSPVLRAEVTGMLLEGLPHKKVLAKFPVGPSTILRLSKEIGAAYRKRGRGRRFTRETWQQILDATRTAKTSREVERKFQIDYDTVCKARRELGDNENRRFRLKITPEQMKRAEDLLRAGEKWRAVACDLGLSCTTVVRHVRYRKRGAREPICA